MTREAIIDTTKTVMPVNLCEVFGPDHFDANDWGISVSCPVNGKYILPGWHEGREAAMRAIENGEF